MGLLLGRSVAFTVETELQEELRATALGESGAAGSGQKLVFFCPRCHRRLCSLAKDRGADSSRAPLIWWVPSSRLEKAWLGNSTTIRCRHCAGRVGVEEATSRSGGPEVEDDEEASSAKQQGAGRTSVVLRPPQPRQIVCRPHSACVLGVYESVVGRASALLTAECNASGHRLVVSRRTLRRSELNSVSDTALPSLPLDLLVVAHRISGQRNPLTDAHGLFTALLESAWAKADVIMFVLFDLPSDGYLSRLLEEQPSLLGLLSAGRLLPLFGDSKDGDAEAEPSSSDVASEGIATSVDVTETGGWMARCLDGRVPRVESASELSQASACGGVSVREAVAAAAAAATKTGNTKSVLDAVAEALRTQTFVRDAV